jgi:hypothetical protein
MLRAYAAWSELRATEPAVLTAWLRRILARTLADVFRHYERDKRAVDLERSLAADPDRSASGLARAAMTEDTQILSVIVDALIADRGRRVPHDHLRLHHDCANPAAQRGESFELAAFLVARAERTEGEVVLMA